MPIVDSKQTRAPRLEAAVNPVFPHSVVPEVLRISRIKQRFTGVFFILLGLVILFAYYMLVPSGSPYLLQMTFLFYFIAFTAGGTMQIYGHSKNQWLVLGTLVLIPFLFVLVLELYSLFADRSMDPADIIGPAIFFGMIAFLCIILFVAQQKNTK